MKSIFTLCLLTSLFLSTNIYSQETKLNVSAAAATNEAEGHIAIDPNDTNRIAIGYMFQNNSGLSFRVYHTNNGGDTWSTSSFDPVSMSSGQLPGTIAGGGDIILAYDKNGKLYVTWIYLFYDFNSDSAYFSGFWASSTDNGASFQFEDTTGHNEQFGIGVLTNFFNNIANLYDGVCDRQWIAVDHSNGAFANSLYVGYVNYTNTFGGMKLKRKSPSSTSFGTPVTTASGEYQLSNVAVDGNGVIHHTFAKVSGTGDGVWHTSSNNGGTSFGSLHYVGPIQNAMPQSNYYANERENAAPSLAIDGNNHLHMAWSSFPGSSSVSYYSQSTDGGTTWSTPLDLNNAVGANCLFANVCASGNKVTISTYALDANKSADYYILFSTNGGQSFSQAYKVSGQSSNIAAFSQSDFLGDYTSSARTACRTYSLWADLRSGGQPKMYVSRFEDCGPVGLKDITTINGDFMLSDIYPNPADDILNLDIHSKTETLVEYNIRDIKGQIWMQGNEKLPVGSSTLKVSCAHLAKGNYLISVFDRNGNKVSRLFSR